MKHYALIGYVLLSTFVSIARADEKKEEPKDPKVFVYDDAKKQIAEIDLKSGKINYEKGADDQKVIAAMLNHVQRMSDYHEAFKKDISDILRSAYPETTKKLDAKAKAEQKKLEEKKKVEEKK